MTGRKPTMLEELLLDKAAPGVGWRITLGMGTSENPMRSFVAASLDLRDACQKAAAAYPIKGAKSLNAYQLRLETAPASSEELEGLIPGGVREVALPTE